MMQAMNMLGREDPLPSDQTRHQAIKAQRVSSGVGDIVSVLVLSQCIDPSLVIVSEIYQAFSS
jgi:hypothetical protein